MTSTLTNGKVLAFRTSGRVLGAEACAEELLASRERGLHVALIMDGNGRWAKRRGRPRREGHRAGAKAVRQVVEAAPPP